MTKEVEAIDPSLVARMVALVKEFAGLGRAYMVADPSSPLYVSFKEDAERRHAEAREIVALLPKPVDPDLLEARTIAAKIAPGHPWVAAILAGSKDDDSSSGVSVALAAIKRGRELAQVSA